MATGRLPDPNSSPLTAKGDLYTYSTVPAKLAVGNNGETLVADSSATTGLRYNPQNALANPVINGGMDNWQRGTSISLAASAGTTYLADRWCTQTSANQATTVSRQATGDTTNLPNIQYAMRYQRNSGQTGTSNYAIMSPIETTNTIPFAGKTVTLSFYARKGANYSATSDILRGILRTGTGTDQNPFAGYTGDALTLDANFTLTTSWQRFAVSGTLPATITQMTAQFNFTPTGTAGAADYYEITGVQVDLGTYTASTAPTFRRSGGTLAGELAACQRYYFRNTGALIYLGSGGIAGSTTQCYVQVKHPTTMRIAPTSLDSSLLLLQIITGSTNVTSASISSATPDLTLILANVASGLTATTQSYMLMTQNTATAHLGLSAEL